jgi:surface protein
MKLKTLDLSGFDTSKVTNMFSLFSNCYELESVDISSFKTGNLTDICQLFMNCKKMKTVDLSNFNLTYVTDAKGMVQGCETLEKLILPKTEGYANPDTSRDVVITLPAKSGYNWKDQDGIIWTSVSVKNPKAMTYTLISEEGTVLPKILYSGIDGDLTWTIDENGLLTVTGNGNYVGTPAWYEYRDYIKSGKIQVTGITNTSFMFAGCLNMTTIDLSRLDTSKVTDMSAMFEGCKNLESLDLSKFDTSNVEDISAMFCACTKLKTLDLSGFDTSKVTDMFSLFASCFELESVDISSFKTGKVNNICQLFVDCQKIQTVDLSNFDLSNVTDATSMVQGCSNLNKLILPAVKGITRPDSSQKVLIRLPEKSGYNWQDQEGNIWTYISVKNPKAVTYTAVSKNKPIQKEDDDKTTEQLPSNTTAQSTSKEETSEIKQPTTEETNINVGDANYRVTSEKKHTVIWIAVVETDATEVSVPDTVNINGTEYKVTQIAENAFCGSSTIVKVNISKNVTEIGKNAFANCKKLKTVTIKSSKLKKIGKNAFKNIHKKAVIKVPRKKYKKYKKLITSKKTGYKNTMKIKKLK